MSVGGVVLMLNRECVRCPELHEGRLVAIVLSSSRILRGARRFNGHHEVQCRLGCVARCFFIDHVEFLVFFSYESSGLTHTRRMSLGALSGQHVAATLLPMWMVELRCHVGVVRRPFPPMAPQECLMAQHVVAMLLHDVGPCSVPFSELQNMLIALPFYGGAVGSRRGAWGRFLLRCMQQHGMWYCFKYTLPELTANGMEGDNHQEYRAVHTSFRDGVVRADRAYAQVCADARHRWSARATVRHEADAETAPLPHDEESAPPHADAAMGVLRSAHYNTLARTHSRKTLQVFSSDPHLVVLFDPHHPVVVQRREVLIDGEGGCVAQLP